MVVLACSGPGAAEAIARAWTLGFAAFGATALGVGVTAALRRWLGVPWASVGNALGLVLVLAHPGCWCAPIGGDCGQARVTLSAAWGAVSLLYVAGAGLSAVVETRRARV